MIFPVFDLHCDTAYALLNNGGTPHDLLSNSLHIDLQKASTLPGYTQCFACFTSPDDTFCKRITPVAAFQLQKTTLLRQLEENHDRIRLAHCGQDIIENQKTGKMSAVLTIEGTAGFNYDPGRLDVLFDEGFRITTLGWNEDNCLVGSHSSGNGLTDRGREYVRRAQNLGMIVDVSHISDAGFWDVMDVTQTSVIASHSNSRLMHPHSRNLTDDMFQAICQTGGVVGINLYTNFLGHDASLDTVCDHILHFLDLDPDGSHIALGGDLDGCESLPKDFEGVQSYPLLAECLMRRGVPKRMIQKLFWQNALEVFMRCCT